MAEPAKNTVNIKKPPEITPMMQQYMQIREEHPDCLLFYRMGDFYELFFDDALKAAHALDIALTKRGQHEGEDIPMCGVPVHSHEQYLHRLIKQEFNVAICEQLEAPEEARKRGYKSVVKRGVVRIVTPGTITEEGLLDARQNNYLTSLIRNKDSCSLAWVDISTGEFGVMTLCAPEIPSELTRLSPKEILIADDLLDIPTMRQTLEPWKRQLRTFISNYFDANKGAETIKKFYGVETLEAFGCFSPDELGVLGSLLSYLEMTQLESKPALHPPRHYGQSHFLRIDASTQRNLELTCSLSGTREGSLLHTIDQTCTAHGGRMLHGWITAPLLDARSILERQEVVAYFSSNSDLRQQVRSALKQLPDMERIISRVSSGRASPRDFGGIRDGLHQVNIILACIEQISDPNIPSLLGKTLRTMDAQDALRQELTNALETELPLKLQEGGIIRRGYHPKLDEYRNTSRTAAEEREELRQQYIKESGIERLKIKDNNVLGLFIELNPKDVADIPEYFTHRQTLASAVRFTTDALRNLEQRIMHATSYSLQLEVDIFQELRERIAREAHSIRVTAIACAMLDVLCSFAEQAARRHYTQPVVDTSLAFDIEHGRHPVVEVALENSSFIANNCNLSETQRLWLLTGPNMAGKSTFLRQNALVAILAQIGSFVPAKKAHIGLIDQLFSRVGAADDLARGQSTFMVEMVETSIILNQSTERSLVILDEIGRGTATFDGLSIAWATLEYLHNKLCCRCLFATHYHELTQLQNTLPRLHCYRMKVKEWQGGIVFQHEVVEGVANKSYGIHVASLAGLPKPVIERANIILHTLEEQQAGTAERVLSSEMPLFAVNTDTTIENDLPVMVQELQEAITNCNPDELSPREALNLIYQWKNIIASDK